MYICFAVLLNEPIFKKFVASLPPYMPALIERLLWEDNLSKQEAEEITGANLLLSDGNAYYSESYETLPGLGLLQVSVQKRYYFSFTSKPWIDRYKEMEIFVSLPPALKNIIISFYPKPEGYYLKPVAAPAGIKIFDAEATLAPEILRSLAYFKQGNIRYSIKGKPNTGGMNKMQRQVGIIEFFTNTSFSTTRTLMIAGLLYGYKSKGMQTDAIAVIKKLFTENYVDAGNRYAPVPPYILTQLKGINYADPHDYKSSINRDILAVLKALPAEQWITAENIVTYLKSHTTDLRPLSDWRIQNYLYYEGSAANEYLIKRKHEVNAYNLSKLVDIPYLKGSLFLFAAFGLLAVAYEDVDTSGEFGKDWFSEYDGLQAVKLTRLGAYVLGFEKEYQPAGGAPAGRLVFDEQALIVRADGDVQLMDRLISSYLDKLSATRYAFSATSFLKDCHSAEDIKNKIVLFKQAAGVPLPPLWEEHLESLVKNTKAIDRQNDIVVFQLAATNKQLQQLIVQDLIIKKQVLKAELFHLLVAKENLSKFKSRMKELGYLV